MRFVVCRQPAKERFSVAYIQALSACAGHVLGDCRPDKDGVDLTLRSSGLMVDLQLKCSQHPRKARRDYVYDLDVATYNRWRHPDRSAPGILGPHTSREAQAATGARRGHVQWPPRRSSGSSWSRSRVGVT